MDIFESLENLNISEECFNDIVGIVEEYLYESNRMRRYGYIEHSDGTKSVKSKEPAWRSSSDTLGNIILGTKEYAGTKELKDTAAMKPSSVTEPIKTKSYMTRKGTVGGRYLKGTLDPEEFNAENDTLQNKQKFQMALKNRALKLKQAQANGRSRSRIGQLKTQIKSYRGRARELSGRDNEPIQGNGHNSFGM
jgi:hypothetical protein